MQNNFEEVLENVEVKAPRNIWSTPKGDIHDCIKKLKEEYNFAHLATITGIENGENFELLYHLAQEGTGILLTIRLIIPIEGHLVKTISDLYQSSVWYEREINDLLGVNFEGIPEGKRYPLPDEWPQGDHPLRKNWKATEETK